MLKKKNPKRPSDYKTLRIRIPPKYEMKQILLSLKTVREQLNKEKKDERKLWMANHVLLHALEIGLGELEKPRKPKPKYTKKK